MTVALLGYGLASPQEQVHIAHELGMYLGNNEANLICGGYQGTLAAGLSACLSSGGRADVVLEENRLHRNIPEHYRLTTVSDTDNKHRTIASRADLGVAIGGGPGSLRLAKRLLAVEKTLFVCETVQGDCLPLLGKPRVIGFPDLPTLREQLEGFLGQ